MYSHAYGTIPIVSRVGGLKIQFTIMGQKKKSTGLCFEAGVEHSLNYALDQALTLYYDKAELKVKKRRIIKLDWSWKKELWRYMALYNRAIHKMKG